MFYISTLQYYVNVMFIQIQLFQVIISIYNAPSIKTIEVLHIVLVMNKTITTAAYLQQLLE
jgi:hypothetical protein